VAYSITFNGVAVSPKHDAEKEEENFITNCKIQKRRKK